MRYLSVCSGIEAATVAWHPLGWEPAAFAEIEAFPSALLAHHYPNVPNLGDMTKYQEWPDLGSIDLVCGGTPCQAFSVAGLRAGLADPRGNLTLTFLGVVARYKPRWVVWENVPGVFSSNSHDAPDPCPPPDPVDMGLDGQEVELGDEYDAIETSAFGSFVAGLSELGYGVAYRTVDAQHARSVRFPHAVPQRRRRVFVVGHLGDWRRAAAVLFDAASLRGNPPPRREAGQRVAPTISSRPTGGGGLGTDFDLDGGLVANSGDVGYCLTASAQQSLDAETDASEDGTGRGTPLVAETLTSNGDAHSGYHRDHRGLIAFDTTQITSKANRSVPKPGDPSHPLAAGAHAPAIAHEVRPINTMVGLRHQALGEATGLGIGDDGDAAYTLSKAHSHAVQAGWAVRRLTPTECERLQGFRDGYTQIPRGNKPTADGPRYKALGNSWATNCAEIIGERIAMIDPL